ncbi:hypothetical protein HO173_010438 [Letharia columbiana]|uniref:MINDY deubiquitinase domain-containing protein n=1 Tax=Letharia columbiana TaxID=112416 RepID=A0A8H6FMJ8_9LECA|nr:uncharacterized protein HO173_010438 [Letharia columbiana]KAF6231295.1 hypothetical protein HO173_010438 [Letharia columbiana]
MMVRKPFHSARGQAAPAVPYPVTPSSPIARSSKLPASPRDVQSQELAERATGGINAPNLADGPRRPVESTMNHELPPPLRVGAGLAGNGDTPLNGGLPSTLQVGSADATPRTSSESQRSNGSARHIRSDRASTTGQPIQRRQRSSSSNPFRRNNDYNGKAPDRPNYGGESSADVWGEGPKTDTRDPFTEPWMDFSQSPEKQPQPQLDSESHLADTRQNPGFATNPAPVSNESMRPYQQALQFESQAVGAPEVDVRPSVNQDNQLGQMPGSGERLADPSYNVWDDARPTSDVINHTPINDSNAQKIFSELPSNFSQPERLPPQPPRPPKTLDNSGNAASTTEVQMPRDESMRPNRAGESYQIRLVNWYDASSPTNPRRSPIMVQNANGPCPLLALVNALVLTTRSDVSTALVETLRVREQVSLGLLLDAVIDELMSGRRRGSGGILPDVSELYAFLVTLHTGMNVNPRFVPSEQLTVNLMDAPLDMPTSLHESRKAGGFEDTREMRFYSTFSIPLIHGWIPPRNHPAFAALKRTAETYEDAQNILFREEELEEKLQRQGLSPEEQLILEDIASVKYFLSSTATQLTGYGLDTVTETLAPGSVAILFRNDHFSTLYRHPKSGQLLTLVTDMGYAGHDEVVWESLVDVSGEGCEFFAGDFRPVGNVAGDTQQQATSNQAEDDSGWTTVGSRSRRGQQSSRSDSSLPALDTLNINDSHPKVVSANTEQEDHDLALAMQLQEEEEERERQESAKRKRDDELSQAYLNSADSQGRRTFPGFGRGASASGGGPSPPPRGRGSARQAPTKSANDDEDAPPPTYEQAANGPAYIPPSNHPVHPTASPSPGGIPSRPGPMSATRPRHSSSAYIEHATSYGHSPSYGPSRRGHMPRSSASGTGRGGIAGVDCAPGVVRRRSGAPGSAVSLEGDKKDKDCVIM